MHQLVNFGLKNPIRMILMNFIPLCCH